MNTQHRGDIERRELAEKALPDHRDDHRPNQKLRELRELRIAYFTARDAVLNQLAHSGDAMGNHLAVIELGELRKARALGNDHPDDVRAPRADHLPGECFGQYLHRRARGAAEPVVATQGDEFAAGRTRGLLEHPHVGALDPAAHACLLRTLAGAKLPEALAAFRREIHLLLKQANYDLGKQQFNTVASATMKMLNALEKAPREGALAAEVIEECFGILLRVLSPLTPHISHALWRELGYGDDILAAAWPEPLEAALVQDEVELMLQVNGKLRGAVRVAADAPKEAIEALALAHEATVKFLEGRPAKKVVVVPGRLVNIVG